MGFMENGAVSGTHSSGGIVVLENTAVSGTHSDWDGFHGEWSSFWYSLIRLGWVSWRIEQFLVLTHQTGMGFMENGAVSGTHSSDGIVVLENKAVSGTHSSDWDGFHGE